MHGSLMRTGRSTPTSRPVTLLQKGSRRLRPRGGTVRPVEAKSHEVSAPPDPHEARMNKKAAEKSTKTIETSDPQRERDGTPRWHTQVVLERRPASASQSRLAQNEESRTAGLDKAGNYSFPTRCGRSYSYCCCDTAWH